MRIINARACPGFCSIKRLGVYIIPPGWDAGPLQDPQPHAELLTFNPMTSRRLLQFCFCLLHIQLPQLKKYCPDEQNEQHFFKCFLILPAVFEEIAAEIVICSILGAPEGSRRHLLLKFSQNLKAGWKNI